MLFTWPDATGAVKYTTTVFKRGYYCPCVAFESSASRRSVPYSSFPYASQQGDYWVKVKVKVRAYGADGSTASYSQSIGVDATGAKVTTTKPNAAAKKANGCFTNGMDAAFITAAGSGTVMAVSFWVPVGGETTAAGIAAAATGAGVATYVVCLVRS